MQASKNTNLTPTKATPKADSGLTYVTDKQLAARYGVKRPAIWRWVKKHGFPAPVKLSPGCTRWPMDEVLEYERRQAEQAAG